MTQRVRIEWIYRNRPADVQCGEWYPLVSEPMLQRHVEHANEMYPNLNHWLAREQVEQPAGDGATA